MRWADRRQAVLDFLGYPTVETAGAEVWLSRTVPHTYPGEPNLYCTEVAKIDGIGPTGSNGDPGGELQASYQHAEITLIYTTPTYDIATDDVLTANARVDANGNPSEGTALALGKPRFVTLRAKPGMKTLVFNRSLIKRADNGNPVLEGVPFIVPHVDFEFTWHQVPKAAINWARWGKTQGKVNDDTFYGFEAETLLMEAPEPRAIAGPFGDRLFDVVFRMRYFPQYDFTPEPAGPIAKGWNYVLAPVGNGAGTTLDMVRMCADGQNNTQPVYKSADFTLCFEPPQ